MVEIKLVSNVPVVGQEAGRAEDVYIDSQLKEILDLIKDGQISAAMKKGAVLNDRYRNNQRALQKIADFMGRFRTSYLRSFSYEAQAAGDSVRHFDFLQVLAYRQPFGEENRLQLSLKYFDKDKVSGAIGFARHSGGFLDVVEYDIGAEASISRGDPETSPINPLSLFKSAVSIRYYYAYLRGYSGYNLGIGLYGDGQLGFTYNGFNVGAGYAYFPYFSPFSGHTENSQGAYVEFGKYFQAGERVGLYGFTKVPIGTLGQGQLPLYLALNLRIKMGDLFGINFQSSCFFTKDYMQGMGGLGIDMNF